MKVLICGGRKFGTQSILNRHFWQQRFKIRDYINTLPQDTIIIHGCANGADSFAGVFAAIRGLDVEEYPAQWNAYGKAAGSIRNRQMLEQGKPDLVVWFHNNITHSKGTKHMITIAQEVGIPVLGNPNV